MAAILNKEKEEQEEEKLTRVSSKAETSPLVNTLFSLRSSVHFTHLTSNGFIEHEILGELYEALNETIDKAIELDFSYTEYPQIAEAITKRVSVSTLKNYRNRLSVIIEDKPDEVKHAVIDVLENISMAIYKLNQ